MKKPNRIFLTAITVKYIASDSKYNVQYVLSTTVKCIITVHSLTAITMKYTDVTVRTTLMNIIFTDQITDSVFLLF